jgi:hypothetical protein
MVLNEIFCDRVFAGAYPWTRIRRQEMSNRRRGWKTSTNAYEHFDMHNAFET